MSKPAKQPSAYAAAGVDIDEMMTGLDAIIRMVKRTSVKGVMSDIGSFGGLFASPGRDRILVASTDGVGTKLKVAIMANRHTTVGQDLVNHCTNDILVQGAKPLFFLDYVGTAQLKAAVFKDIIGGLCKACRENGCALLGGETAEMPGLYPAGEYDLVGTIIGVVDRRKVITGARVRPGDVLIGLPSTGLHTNGYSLARRVIFETAGLSVNDPFPGTSKTVADVLLAVHRSYLRPVSALMGAVDIHGMAHLTGGGFSDNIPRILPDGCRAVVDRRAWRVPPVFSFIGEQGRVDREEMYRVFNMGIGFILVVPPRAVAPALARLRVFKTGAVVVGGIVKGRKGVDLAG